VKKTLKRMMKKMPFGNHLYRQLKSWRDSAVAKRLFANHELYIRALAKKGEGTVVLKTHDGLSITIRQNLWDARIIHEMFIDKPYIRHFKLPPNPIIVDVGGYIGDFSIYSAHCLNAKKVIVFEPTSENFEILLRNIKNNGFEDRITAVNKAVSNSSEVVLNVDIQESEEVHVSAYWYQDAESRTVPSVTVAEVLEDYKLDSIDLLKVDCEGGEYDIFPNLTDATYSRINNIVFEHHDVGEHEKQLDRILNRLHSAGYTTKVEASIGYAYRE
jgi:FkbM family methyltransferase